MDKHEERLTLALESADIGIWDWDIPTGHIVFNEHWAQMLGYQLSEIEPHMRGWEQLLHPEDAPHVIEALNAHLRGETKTYTAEYRLRCKSGDWLWTLAVGRVATRGAAGDPLRACGTHQFINDREQVEIEREQTAAALRQNEEQYRLLAESTADFIIVHGLDGNIVYINSAGLRFSGYSVEDLIGCSIAKIIPPEELAGMYERKAQRQAGNARQYLYETTFINASGQYIPVEIQSVPIVREGRVDQIMLVARDMRKRKQAEQERLRLEEQLQQVQKMEALGRLAGGVAHDLNNLLTPILSYSDLLLDDLARDNPHYDWANAILQASLSARDLVHQLLAFGRKQALEMRLVNLNDVLARFSKLLHRTLRENITLKITPAPELELCNADIGQIEQVIMNLTMNAQDAMAHGGVLTIETANVILDEAYASQHKGAVPGRYVMLGVSDTGSGIDKAAQAYIFEPFFTTKEQGRGTGLGLSTVYGIVKQHHGNIWVYSEPGEGATFKVYIPAAQSVAATTPISDPEPVALQGQETIIVVEDDNMVRQLIKDILIRQGYTVLLAASGAECVKILRELHQPPHLLITDVVMPDINGKDLRDKVIAERPNLKVLFMSGYTDNVIARHGILEGDVNFIQKPFSIKGLAAKVRAVLDQV